jgi:glucose/arabinose dehydrogenase
VRGSLLAACAVIAGALLVGDSAHATAPGFNDLLVAGGLTNPTAMALAPDGRVFVSEQGGTLRVIQNGTLLPTPFLSLSVDSNGERGLLGIAFDPAFGTNHFVYVYYTVPAAPIHNRVSRFTASGNVAVPGSEQPILDLDNLSGATNHNGGAIHFGSDGKLYVAVGENANSANSQTLSNRLGKILRINSDGSIPGDNPFSNDPNVTGPNKAIWALGLRNPFTFTFQPGTGRMFVNDVGETTWEEINDGIAGSNYGWPTCEGFCQPANPAFRDPLFRYGHGGGSTLGCAIVGAAFYNPPVVQFPADFVGDYFFGDLCNGWIRRYDPVSNQVFDFANGITSLVDIIAAPDGSLYYLSRGSGAAAAAVDAATGSLRRISSIPTAVAATAFRAVRRGFAVALSWRPGGDADVVGFDLYRNAVRLNRAPLSRSFLDRRPGTGRPLYRLEAVYLDGSTRAVASATPPRTGARRS